MIIFTCLPIELPSNFMCPGTSHVIDLYLFVLLTSSNMFFTIPSFDITAFVFTFYTVSRTLRISKYNIFRFRNVLPKQFY